MILLTQKRITHTQIRNTSHNKLSNFYLELKIEQKFTERGAIMNFVQPALRTIHTFKLYKILSYDKYIPEFAYTMQIGVIADKIYSRKFCLNCTNPNLRWVQKLFSKLEIKNMIYVDRTALNFESEFLASPYCTSIKVVKGYVNKLELQTIPNIWLH